MLTELNKKENKERENQITQLEGKLKEYGALLTQANEKDKKRETLIIQLEKMLEDQAIEKKDEKGNLFTQLKVSLEDYKNLQTTFTMPRDKRWKSIITQLTTYLESYKNSPTEALTRACPHFELSVNKV